MEGVASYGLSVPEFVGGGVLFLAEEAGAEDGFLDLREAGLGCRMWTSVSVVLVSQGNKVYRLSCIVYRTCSVKESLESSLEESPVEAVELFVNSLMVSS